MRDAFNTFSIRADTDQQLLSDQGLLCLIIQKGYNIVDMTSNLLGQCTNVKFIIATTLEKLKEHIEISLSVCQSVQNLR